MSSNQKIKNIIEAALLAASKPLNLDSMLNLFLNDEKPDRKELRSAIEELQQEYAERSIELVEVGSGFRIHVRSEFVPWVSRLWEERPPRYSRALLETLALIAYRQPITRGEIEDVRGVSVSSSIIKTLIERDWIRVVGHRDVPGKPSLLATTKEFLDYFGMKGLGELPTLAEIKDLDSFYGELDLEVDAESETNTDTDTEVEHTETDGDPEVVEESAAAAEGDTDTTDDAETADEPSVEVKLADESPIDETEAAEQTGLSEQHGG